MKSEVVRILLSIFALGLSATTILSQGGAALSLTQLGAGARPAGMGGACTAVADDANSVYWNPANMAIVAGPELTGTHVGGYLGTTYDNIAGLIPLDIMGRRSAIGFYLFRAATGDILLTDGPADTTFEVHGPERGTLEANCISVALGRRLSSNVLVGGSAKIIRTHLIDAYAAGAGFDLALSAHFPGGRTIFRGVSSAAVIRNLGTTLSWSTGRTEPLTPTLTIGLAYRPWTPDRILVSADMEKPLKPSHSRVRWRFGVEFLFGQVVPLRFGYEEQSISTGAGFNSDHIRLDYAFSFHRELAGSHRVSLTLAR